MLMILIMVDECGDEVEVDRYNIGDDLDADYLHMWKQMKIEKAYQQYPEARNFYFEDQSAIERAARISVHDFFGDYGYEEDEWDE